MTNIKFKEGEKVIQIAVKPNSNYLIALTNKGRLLQQRTIGNGEMDLEWREIELPDGDEI